MITQSLNGSWEMRILGENIFGITEEPVKAQIPGSVYGTLLQEGMMPDPYYRDNELDALKLMNNDFAYTTIFSVNDSMLKCDVLYLRFEGIDTLADIYINDVLVGHADNMHRIWEYDVLANVVSGDNRLRVYLHSPIKYIKEENEKVFTGGSTDAMEGFPHLRKAHCMFGWDWGPRLPDAGIFRKVSLVGYDNARLDLVYITQEHETDKVTLDFDISVQLFTDKDDSRTKITVTAPDGKVYLTEDDKITIDNPALWWPNGYGEQPLYTARVDLVDGKGCQLDVWEKKIGLRTMKVNTAADQWGNCFAHEVNGIKIFAMGADYIPEDNILSRVTRERTERLLRDAVAVHHNVIRVWGGGYYPDDYFYDLCDELGLVVWQDFMFACASYELDDAFEANIVQEAVDNIRRIRHHACLGIWCGNNEMETQTLDKAWKPSIKQKYDYIKIFEYILPKVIKEEDPDTFYWPSSPSSGGNFDNPWDENKGDTHYWAVWHGDKPFTEYRKFYFRYLSEFGFQSFPAMRTIETFTEEGDRNIFSRVMEMHQRNCAANGKIMNYLSATYLYPNSFELLVYASQLLQAEAIRYGVEHFRRHRGRCMGSVIWQLNDIWPVASWASIDYYGRWKALHYMEKRIFAPVAISCEEIGELSERPFCVAEPAPIEKSARLHVANETRQEVVGKVYWELRKPDSSVVKEGIWDVEIPALDGLWLDKQDFSEYNEREIHLSYRFETAEGVVSAGSCLFTPPKHYAFVNPELTYRVEEKQIYISARAYAKNVEIAGVDGDIWLSDNYFDMEAGEYCVEILRGDATRFAMRSVYDIR